MTLSTPVRFEFSDVPFELEPAEGGGFVARNDQLQVAVIGATQDEATASFRDGVRQLIAFCVEHQLPLPAVLQPA